VRVALLLALLLLLPHKAFGAIAVDNVTNQIGTPAASITWPHPTSGANRLLIVSVSTRGGSVVTQATYAGLPLTFFGAQNNDTNPLVRIEMWYRVLDPLSVPTPAPGTYNVVVDLSASTNVIGTAVTLTGVNQVVPLGAFQSASSTGAGSNMPTVTVASTPGDMVIDTVTTQGDAGTFTQDPVQTLLQPPVFNGTNPAGVAQAGSRAGGASSVTMSWTLGVSVRWAIGAVSVRSAVAISGAVFEDADFAGTAYDYDGGAGDLGLQSVDVELYDGSTNAYITSTNTAADGTFSFPGLSNGTYKVRARSATIGDADTPPRGGLNGTVPLTWPYPLPEMTWANGAALYGGVSSTVDDTATGDNNGPGDTYTTVTVTGADVPNVNLGFAYNLIVNTSDDNRNPDVRSTQGSLRQFIKNANAIGAAGGTTANSSQFRMQVPANQSSGADTWWRFTVANRDLPALSDNGATIDGSTQRQNSGTDSNSRGPEIEITGLGTFGTAIGLQCSGNAITLRELVITAFSLYGILVDGANNSVEGSYVGTDATGTADLGNGEDGVRINGSNNTIGGASAARRNVISGNNDEGVDINPGAAGNVVIGNYIGTNAAASVAIANGLGGASGGVVIGGSSNRVGGSAPGEGNVIAGNAPIGLRFHMAAAGNIALGNFIGTNASGATTIGNTGGGVVIEGDSTNNTVGGTAAGETNTIAYNGGDGVFITGLGSDRNRISGNAIFANGGLGIDLDPDGVGVGTGGGVNNDKAAPVITGLTASGSDFIITATTVSAGNTIEFFRANNSPVPLVNPDPSGSGEGYLYLGRCVDNGACNGPYISAGADGNPVAGTVQATLLAGGVAGGDTISATASDAANGTSEFSANAVAPVTLAIVKQAWLENGGAPLSSPLTAPAGSTIVFLIYVRNTTAITVTDVRINDALDETAFQFVPGSLVRTVAAAPPADTATDLAIFNATAPGTGTNLSDSVDVDAASAQNMGGLPDADRITVGAVAGQANGSLTIAGHTTFSIRFRVTVK
jgi:hypothetical protein